MPTLRTCSLLRSLVTVITMALVAGVGASSVASAAPSPAWTITTQYADLAPGDVSGNSGYFITATNTGGAPTDGSPVKLTDNLPVDLSAAPAGPVGSVEGISSLSCSAGPPAECTDEEPEPVAPGRTISMWVPVEVAASPPSTVTNQVSVSGGGLATVSVTSRTPISATPSVFGFQSVEGATTGVDGSAVTQAGSHPYELRSSFALNAQFSGSVGELVPTEDPKNLTVNLPAGLVVNPNATPIKCTESELEQIPEGNKCPDASAVGTVTAITGVFLFSSGADIETSPIYNMVPPPGAPAALGFNAVGLGLYEHVLGGVRTGGDYGLSANLQGIPQRGVVLGAVTTLWGSPSDPSHDALRGRCAFVEPVLGERCPVPATNTAFLTMPSACSGPLTTTISADSWQQPGNLVTSGFESHDANGNPVGVEGCDKLAFTPTISVQPETSAADSPTGLRVNLHVPQEGLANPDGLAEANLKKAVVTLPEGMAISPSAANGLGACTPGEIGLNSADTPSCPDASKVGEAEVETPLLEHPLKGAVYLAAQETFEGSLIGLYLVAEGQGALIKVGGKVTMDPVSGRLTTTFGNNPQLPFSDLRLTFFGGPRGALITPLGCGTYTTTSQLTPWSSTIAAELSSSFTINQGCGTPGFAPAFTAGASNNQAGAFSPFSVTFSRHDGEQRLSSAQVTTPPGLLGILKSVLQCPEPQASQGACGPESQIGETTVAAGPGGDPYWVKGGRVYLTGPYNGAPFGLSIVVPAVAGPFDLGSVVVRARVGVDPHTAQVIVTSDPFPTILRGIPLDVRTVNVTINRAGFMFNPTNCSPLAVTGTLTATSGASAAVSSPFQAANCATLPFKPTLSASTEGRASKAKGASLRVRVASGTGQANIAKADLTLPVALPSRLTTIQKACVAAVFEANPAACDEGSVIGSATVRSPALKSPLTGPAYLVSHGGAAFPDVEFVLQGEGVTLMLDGKTDIKKGVTYSRFETVPDAPVETFEAVLPMGPHSALTSNVPAKAKFSLCGTKLVMPTVITGQNGAVINQSTKVAVTGCPKAKLMTRAQKLAQALKACKAKSRKKRPACIRKARSKYGPIQKKRKK